MSAAKDIKSLFAGLPALISPDVAAERIDCERTTVYDWRYRPEKYEPAPPAEMWVKVGRKLKLRTSVLESYWLKKCGVR